jgi:branched-chain amino acid transport system permease protein
MTVFVQLVVSALGFGGIYALAALGLTIIFKTSNVVNFAYGAMATVVAMLVWTAHASLGLPTALAWALGIIGGGAMGIAVDLGLMRRVEGSAPLVSIVMTIGLLLAVEGLTGVIWGYGPKGVANVVGGRSFSIGPISVDRNDLFVAALAVVVAVALHLFYERTRLGLAVRAVAADAETASLMGVSRKWVLAGSWAAGVAVAGAAATLAAPSLGLTPTLMDDAAVFAFAAAVLGGLGSLIGAVVGGFAVGILSDLVAGYISTNLQLTVVFALIVVVLYLRPQGLFGRAAQVRQ